MAEEIRFTYTHDPSRSGLDAVRFYTGDVERSSAMLDDREIEFALTQNPTPKIAAAVLLEQLAARYARKADISVGQVSKALGAVSDKLAKRAKELRSSVNVAPFFGGLTISGKQELDGRTDDVQPHFKIGQFDDREAGQFDGMGSDPSDGEA